MLADPQRRHPVRVGRRCARTCSRRTGGSRRGRGRRVPRSDSLMRRAMVNDEVSFVGAFVRVDRVRLLRYLDRRVLAPAPVGRPARVSDRRVGDRRGHRRGDRPRWRRRWCATGRRWATSSAGYFLSGYLFASPSPSVESWLMAWDRRLLGDPATRFVGWPRAARRGPRADLHGLLPADPRRRGAAGRRPDTLDLSIATGRW